MLDIDLLGAWDDQQSGRVLVVGLVAQVLDQGQLLGVHLLGDLGQDLGRRDLVGQRGDDDVAVFHLELGALTHRSVAAAVHRQQLVPWGDDGRIGGEVRPLNVAADDLQRGVGVVEQVQQGLDHLAQIVRRDVGGHADGDAGAAVEQHIGQPGRQHRGLLQGAVEVGQPVDRAQAGLAQQHVGERGQPRLGVAHRGEGLGVVGRAPVALTVDQRIAGRERLRHQHHGLVAGRVAVRVELAEHVADGAGGLLVLGPGAEAELGHGVDDAPLHRLEAVAEVRQGAVQDYVHGVIEVGLFGERR